MKSYEKRDLPVSRVGEVLEPGPVVLVSSRWKGRNNIMTMGWHTVIERVFVTGGRALDKSRKFTKWKDDPNF